MNPPLENFEKGTGDCYFYHPACVINTPPSFFQNIPGKISLEKKYLWKNGWINRERWDISLIQSERWDILKKRLDKPAMVGYGFESFQTVGHL